jgi:hypothetical protein
LQHAAKGLSLGKLASGVSMRSASFLAFAALMALSGPIHAQDVTFGDDSGSFAKDG